MLRDFDIRAALHATEITQIVERDPSSLVLDELGVCQGDVRIDVAVVNGALHGWEIKSERDTLERLPGQMEAYSRVFNFVTIVTGANHLESIEAKVPSWWGIVEATRDGAHTILREVRSGTANQGVDAFSVAQLLWREEALGLLEANGGTRGLKSKPRAVLWSALAERMTMSQLASSVRQTLKARQGWRRNR